jgi:hypothetical protein
MLLLTYQKCQRIASKNFYFFPCEWKSPEKNIFLRLQPGFSIAVIALMQEFWIKLAAGNRSVYMLRQKLSVRSIVLYLYKIEENGLRRLLPATDSIGFFLAKALYAEHFFALIFLLRSYRCSVASPGGAGALPGTGIIADARPDQSLQSRFRKGRRDAAPFPDQSITGQHQSAYPGRTGDAGCIFGDGQHADNSPPDRDRYPKAAAAWPRCWSAVLISWKPSAWAHNAVPPRSPFPLDDGIPAAAQKSRREDYRCRGRLGMRTPAVDNVDGVNLMNRSKQKFFPGSLLSRIISW